MPMAYQWKKVLFLLFFHHFTCFIRKQWEISIFLFFRSPGKLHFHLEHTFYYLTRRYTVELTYVRKIAHCWFGSFSSVLSELIDSQLGTNCSFQPCGKKSTLVLIKIIIDFRCSIFFSITICLCVARSKKN